MTKQDALHRIAFNEACKRIDAATFTYGPESDERAAACADQDRLAHASGMTLAEKIEAERILASHGWTPARSKTISTAYRAYVKAYNANPFGA